MSDLISRQGTIDRQDTIDRINEYIEEYSEIDSDGNHSEKWCAMQEAKMTIKNMPPAQSEQRWIPSGEKPPEEGSYLVWMPFAPPKHRMTVAKYCGGYWNIKTPISAWMPLPEPYGGDQDEAD